MILEPSTLPITISEVPAGTDRSDAMSSGSDVPKPTNTTPMRKGGKCRLCPIVTYAEINIRAPWISTARLAAKVVLVSP